MLNASLEGIWKDISRLDEAEKIGRRMQFLDKIPYEARLAEERLDDLI